MSSPIIKSSKLSKVKNFVKDKKKMLIGIGIIFILLVIFLLYWFVFRNTGKKNGVKTKNVIPYIHDAKIQKTVKDSKIPDSTQGNEYNISFWIYINDYEYKYNDKKTILFKGDRNDLDSANPAVYLMPKENSLMVSIGLQTETSTNPNDSQMNIPNSIETFVDNNMIYNNGNGLNEVNNFSQQNINLNSNIIDDETLDNPFENVSYSNSDQCIVRNIPLQRWVSVNLALHNNLLDISINGKLEKSCVLKGFPKINKGDLHIGHQGGFNGYISNVIFTNKVITSEDIEKLYIKGPTLQPGFF